MCKACCCLVQPYSPPSASLVAVALPVTPVQPVTALEQYKAANSGGNSAERQMSEYKKPVKEPVEKARPKEECKGDTPRTKKRRRRRAKNNYKKVAEDLKCSTGCKYDCNHVSAADIVRLRAEYDDGSSHAFVYLFVHCFLVYFIWCSIPSQRNPKSTNFTRTFEAHSK